MATTGSYRSVFDAVYFDGRSPVRNDVTVTVTREGLKLLNKYSSTSSFWAYADIKQTNDIHTDRHVKIEKKEDNNHEVLIIEDTSIIDSIKSISPDSQDRFRQTFNRTKWIKTLVYSFVGAVIAVFIIYKWLLPSFINIVAEIIPVSWEESIGNRYKAVYVQPFPKCDDEDVNDSVNFIKDKLIKSLKVSPYKYDISIIDNSMINAFALPGGSILVFNGLIKATSRPEELAGVIAHEIQHIEQRHSTKMILREASFGLLVSAVTGNSEGFEMALNTARRFGTLGYSRESEQSADVQGVKMLINSGIDPTGMTEFFKIVREKQGDMSGVFKYLSTHPSTDDRIENLNNIIKGYSFETGILLKDKNWDEIKNKCRATDKK